MAHFAKLGSGNIVERVEVVSNDIAITEQAGIDFLKKLYNEPYSVWKQTSYNTHHNKYYNLDRTLGDQSKAFRGNFAGVGFRYYENLNCFVEPRPHNSWTLNITGAFYEPPVEYPEDGNKYIWNESIKNWSIIES
jgi:hypothetical protein